MKKLAPILIVVILLLTACLPGNIQIPQSPLLSKLERKSGLIAYIGADGNIYVSDQGGGHKVAVTSDADITKIQSGAFLYYEQPTWSMDSSHLAFVGSSGTGGSISGSSLHIADVDENKATKVYASESESPIFISWSPDDQKLGYLSTTVSGQTMMLQSIPVDGGERTILDTGAPFYWSWSPDGSSMIIHSGDATSSVPPRLSFIQVGNDIIEDRLEIDPASFQAPAWSPDGQHILITRQNKQNQNEIILTDSHGKFEKAVGNYNFATSFAWSYDSELVAYIDGESPLNSGVLGKLHVLDLTADEDFFQDDNVIAVFWSPNSRKLAYFKPLLIDPETGEPATSQTQSPVFLLELHVLDVISGESKEITKFRPTNPFANILPYFDQYHQSVTIWSPDNNNLVLSLILSDGSPGIAIIAASGQLEPRLLDQGFIAFWSWK